MPLHGRVVSFFSTPAVQDLMWTLEHVTQSGSPRPRLSDVSCEIPSGGVTVVVGYSGAGKTSLLNLLVDFERPVRGEVVFTRPAPPRLPLFWTPQDDGLWPHLTAHEHLSRVAPQRGLQAVASADRWLTAFGLQSAAGSRPDRLSQGERSRLSVARALAADPAVLVMDEPLVHVDPARAPAYWRTIAEAVKASAMTVVIATHAPEVVLGLADRVLCLAEGRLAWSGPVQELYERAPTKHLAEFLGPVNWLTDDDQRLCEFPVGQRGPCVRPEHISVTRASAGPFRVQNSQFLGAIARTTLVHAATDGTLELRHRPSRANLNPGDNAVVRLIED